MIYYLQIISIDINTASPLFPNFRQARIEKKHFLSSEMGDYTNMIH